VNREKCEKDKKKQEWQQIIHSSLFAFHLFFVILHQIIQKYGTTIKSFAAPGPISHAGNVSEKR
jgi:hypothetical protein